MEHICRGFLHNFYAYSSYSLCSQRNNYCRSELKCKNVVDVLCDRKLKHLVNNFTKRNIISSQSVSLFTSCKDAMWMGRDSSVGIATCNGLDGPEIESRWEDEIFLSLPDRSLVPPNLLYNGYKVSFPGVKRPGRGVDHPPPSSAEVKERVELHIYSVSGPSWLILGRNLLIF